MIFVAFELFIKFLIWFIEMKIVSLKLQSYEFFSFCGCRSRVGGVRSVLMSCLIFFF